MLQKTSWFVGIVSAAVGMFITAGIAYAVVPTLSQTNITVGLGQTVSVTSENGIGVYMESNSSPSIGSVSINGTQIAIIGQQLGSSAIDLCAVGTALDCTNLTLTVQAASVSGISFSQNNLSLPIGGNQSVTISGGSGTYTISSNSNTSVASTNLSGNTLTISGLAAGGTTINVCDLAGTCGILSVTITSSGTSGLSFSQNNFSLVAGGSQIVTVSGGNGTYTVPNNSNVSVASANLSGNAITVYAIAAGDAAITACDTSNVCGTLSIIVTAPAANQAVMFSVANPTLTVGQSLNVGLSGSNAPSYIILSNTNTNVVQASVTSGVTLSLYGASAGTASLTMCATGGGCSALSVTVTGLGSASTAVPAATTTVPVAVAPTAAPTATSITQSGTIIANTTLLGEIQTLQAAVTQVLAQIGSIQTQINQLEAQVNAGDGSGISANAVTNTPSGTAYNFTEFLTAGSSDTQVTALQQRLTALGFYSGPITGFYGTLTGQAVTKYQNAHGIVEAGYVGPNTRAALNAGN